MTKYPTKAALNQEDIKTLKYQCRAGIIVSLAILILGIACVWTIKFSYSDYTLSNKLYSALTLLMFILLAIIIGYLMTGKYLKDIRNGYKYLEIKRIESKESEIDFEAGSGTLYIGQKMNSFNSYSLIIERYRYRVEKELYEKCNEGDEVIFHIAPISKHRIKIEKLKNK
ncbi:MAG: hypothetical protein K9J13_12880 [Saprospiraceae bacterium]|nr:hypothetical protein [Saprospiraceae bacterium]